ncbi:MAG: amidohydrolase family protein, partial [Gemmatimonadetes bacterium]|nr:amidohydrolase family protein [Gemmatimonadota bacterium]NIQ56838.1 amidohydrolase family protein [Gemmatimonadota bacterium]NIU77021.1 amidohydrolase family protein [Gammaproteobacteria bacterium]NIX46360.1 amidohydrolase family protein [Gemmatimonadota bacterium]NIY10682.1 amidohydrolase family protein [Gemmatimonadota bacterium]
QAPEDAPPPIALVGATLIDGTGAPPVPGATVVVREGRIACAGPAADCPVPDDARRIDVAGRWITPGLIDAHVHYSQTGWADGRPDALDLRDEYPYEETVHWLETHPDVLGRGYLCSGVTATFDVGGYPWTWGLRSRSDTSGLMPHVEAAGPLLSTRDHWLNLPAERQFVFIPDDSAVEAGVDYLAVNGTSAVKVWFLVGARSDTAALRHRLETAATRAREAGIPLIVHATGLWDATVAVENGAHLLVHSVQDEAVDERFLRAAREAGTLYTPTLVVYDGYAQLAARRFEPGPYGDALACVDPTSLAKARATDEVPGGIGGDQLESLRARAAGRRRVTAENLRRVRDAGIPVVLGTDAGNPLTLHGPSVYLELEAMADAGLSPAEVLVAATRDAARAMGREDDLGTLEPGKVADLLVLRADPLADVRGWRA